MSRVFGITNPAVAQVSQELNLVRPGSPPAASAQSVTTPEDTAVNITLVATDADGDSLTYTVTSGPSHGVLTGTAPNLTYTPSANYNGPDSFVFQANDGSADSLPATVNITVTAVNDAPVANTQSVSTPEDTAVNIVLTGSDADGNPLTYAVVVGPSNGALTGTAPNLTYTPNASYNGPDSFTFRVNDGYVNSSTATVNITVTAVNNAPVANAQSVSTAEDTPLNITLTGSDTDGDTLTYSIVTGPSNGALTGSAPEVTYTPNANYNGPDSFTFRVNDGYVNSSTVTVSITVTAVNDAPVADAQSVSTEEDTAVNITLTGSDIDGNSLTYTVVAGPSNGSLTGVAPNLTYTPSANYNGPDSFTFRVNDGYVNSSAATVSITVTAANDAPVADAQSVSTAEDTAVNITLTGSDADGNSLTYTVVAGPSNGSLTGTAPNLTYTPNANYNGPDSFTFRVNDGYVNSSTATVSITVTAVNDTPVANAQSVSTAEDTAVNITLTGSDIDGNSLTYTVVAGPSNGSLTGTAPNLTYTPSANYNGPDSFTFRVNDGYVNSSTATVSITVTAVNDAPVANAQSASVNQDGSVQIILTGSDVEGSSLTYAVVTSPTNGTLSGTAPNLTYTPNSGYSGPDSFTFRVNDGSLDSTDATVSITVNASVLDVNFDNVSLLIKADGANNSTSFVDSSPRPATITAVGNAKISTVQSKFGGSSAAFDGTGDYLTASNNSQYYLSTSSTGDFTVEAWVYKQSTGRQVIVSQTQNTVSPFAGWLFYVNASNFIRFEGTNGSAISGASTFPLNEWVHVAAVRFGSTTTVYVNGTSVASGTVSITDFNGTLTVGQYTSPISGSEWNGYIDDLRITRGVARYTANFAVPSAHLTDGPDLGFMNTSLLLKADGSNGSTTFTDSSQHALVPTRVGNTVISTAQSKFGGSSIFFDGAGDRLSYAPNSDRFDFDTSDFTIECWFYIAGNSPLSDSSTRTASLVATFPSSGTITGYNLAVNGNSTTTGTGITFENIVAGTAYRVQYLATIAQNTWHHVAVARSGSFTRLFLNGVFVDQRSLANQSITSSNALTVGGTPYAGYTGDLNGYIDDLRITRGLARYASSANFSPPASLRTTGPSTDPYIVSTSLLLKGGGSNGDTTFTDSSRNALSISRVGNTVISTAQSKFGGSSILFDGSGDALLAPNNAVLQLGTGAFTIEGWVYLTAANGNDQAIVTIPHSTGELQIRYGNSAAYGSKLQVYMAAQASVFSCPVTQSTNLDTWAHIAFTRDSTGTCRLFFNGVRQNLNSGFNPSTYPSSGIGSSIDISGTSGIIIGAGNSSGGSSLSGYIDDMRVTKGIARYVGNFVVPTSLPTT